ncbi:ClpP family protease [Brevibacillus sp. NRS-1366]|uniref:ClpP family protease n=1 Tax=Brevibacillus sp. NRS-1366 TaxID=3233899 RepID=UPI003D21FCF8
MDKQLKIRKVLLSDFISSGSVNGVIKEIFEINYDDDLKENEYKDFERNPIELYINSFGGSCYDGLALVDTIRNSKTPVHTYCFGSAMSMGLWIYLAGASRFAGKNCTFMYHEVSSFVWDKLEGLKQEVKEMQRLQDMYDAIIKENTNIMQDKLDAIKERKAEWYIPTEDALKLGICHEII